MLGCIVLVGEVEFDGSEKWFVLVGLWKRVRRRGAWRRRGDGRRYVTLFFGVRGVLGLGHDGSSCWVGRIGRRLLILDREERLLRGHPFLRRECRSGRRRCWVIVLRFGDLVPLLRRAPCGMVRMVEHWLIVVEVPDYEEVLMGSQV